MGEGTYARWDYPIFIFEWFPGRNEWKARSRQRHDSETLFYNRCLIKGVSEDNDWVLWTNI